MTLISVILALIICYLLGSVMTGVIISTKVLKQDVRSVGSGGAGMTNVLRNYGKLPAILTAVGDFAKGVIAVLIARFICTNLGSVDPILASYIGAYAVLVGHAYPIFFQFKGGKGVMTGVATLFVINWKVALLALSVFGIVVLVSRYVSLGSVLAAVSFPIILMIIRDPFIPNIICGIGMALFVAYLHRGNIGRLINGTENRLGAKKS